MAVYKLFASKDATIYSEHPTMNTGMDAILELSRTKSFIDSGSAVARILIAFDTGEITDVLTRYGIQSESYYLRLFLSEALEIPTGYDLLVQPVATEWSMGTGRYLNYPYTTNGVNWNNATADRAWDTPGGDYNSEEGVIESFKVYGDKDVQVDVSPIMSSAANGFIIRNTQPAEFDPNYQYTLSFFSRDTNTIYPPVLEIRWDDSFYDSSITGSIVTTPDLNITLANNRGEYHEEDVVRFRLNVREQYPARRFATSSLYTEQQFLPPTTYWAIQDVRDDIMVVNFDEQFTKVSADTKSNYFDIYMNGLEPERYYKLLVKTVVDNQTIVYDNHYFFKIKE
jgi:hypothetical protein